MALVIAHQMPHACRGLIGLTVEGLGSGAERVRILWVFFSVASSVECFLPSLLILVLRLECAVRGTSGVTLNAA